MLTRLGPDLRGRTDLRLHLATQLIGAAVGLVLNGIDHPAHLRSAPDVRQRVRKTFVRLSAGSRAEDEPERSGHEDHYFSHLREVPNTLPD